MDPVGLVVPAGCACCGAVAGSSRVETRARDGGTVIVPYCSGCQRHASAAGTRKLATTLASCVLAGTLAAALPVLCGGASPVTLALLSLGGALLPLGVGALWRRAPGPGHSASGRAVWWLPTGELACTSSRWAAELCENNGLAARPVRVTERLLSPWMVAGPLLALAALPLFYWLLRPEVRVVNLTYGRITVLVDERAVATVEPTSVENPTAGELLHVPAGVRRLQAETSAGLSIADYQVIVRSGRQHLYAPGSGPYCFWLETNGYGKAGAGRVRIDPLEGQRRFWVLPRIDSWFAPNPPPSEHDDRSSGGVLTALRQARCNEAPAAVRDLAASRLDDGS